MRLRAACSRSVSFACAPGVPEIRSSAVQELRMATREAISDARSTLAARLEGAHLWSMREYTNAVARRCPAVGATAMEVAGGLAIFAGASAFSVAVGAGFRCPVSAPELDRIERFFHQRGVPAAVEVCPSTHPSLHALLQARNYAVREITHVLYCDFNDSRLNDSRLNDSRRGDTWLTDDEDAPELPSAPGIELRWAGDAEAAFVVDVMVQFFYESDPGPEARANIEARLCAPNSLNAIAAVNGRWAGAAGGLLPAPGQIAVLSCSATLPEFRRRGVHSALLKFRLRQALRHGCAGAMVAAIPGSISERNLERHGFSHFCEKRTYMK